MTILTFVVSLHFDIMCIHSTRMKSLTNVYCVMRISYVRIVTKDTCSGYMAEAFDPENSYLASLMSSININVVRFGEELLQEAVVYRP